MKTRLPELLDKLPPVDKAAEGAALGSIILDGGRFDEVASIVDEDDSYDLRFYPKFVGNIYRMFWAWRG